MVKIVAVEKHSIAARIGIRANDMLLSVNGNEICDVLDYRFYMTEERVCLSVLREGKEKSFTAVKDEYEDIGLVFETPLMDKKHTCANKCIFCFIDQMPKGYRETLYFKDDDSRLSFLHGSYVTLTNMTDKDIDRLIKMRLSPINVSVHTTNPELRVKMMKNKRAGEVLKYLERIKDAGLKIHAQIVLCRGVNDGEELIRSMHDLATLYPSLDSVSVVPAGLTKFREGLYPLSPYTPKECKDIIETVDSFAQACKKHLGAYIFHAADELYLKAGVPLPSEERYEEYPQIENGVGMLTSLRDEFLGELSYLKEEKKKVEPRTVSLATGHAAYPMMCELSRLLTDAFPELTVLVYDIENSFFGPEITVSGLLTGKDLAEQLKGKPLGCALLIPRNSLRSEGDLFLCGMSKEELGFALGVPVFAVEGDGVSLLYALLGEEE